MYVNCILDGDDGGSAFESRVFACMHCMYGEICCILENSLCFMLALLSLIFFRSFEERVQRGYTFSSMFYCYLLALLFLINIF